MSEFVIGSWYRCQSHLRRRRKRGRDAFDRHQIDAVLNLSLEKLPGHLLLPETTSTLNNLLAVVRRGRGRRRRVSSVSKNPFTRTTA